MPRSPRRCSRRLDRVAAPGRGSVADLGIVTGSERSLDRRGTVLLLKEASAMSGTRRKPGGLGRQVEGYRKWLAHRGYTSSTVRNMLKELGQVGRWLEVQQLEAEQLDELRIAAFIAARRAAGYR